jgi:hypothetical protein
MNQNENRIVSDLHEEITDMLRGESAAVQIKTVFAILATVLTDCANRDPQEMKRAALELQAIMNLAQ